MLETLPFDEVALVAGVVQVLKQFVPDEKKKKIVPIIAVSVGVVLSLGMAYGEGELAIRSGITGLIYGLAASGFYSYTKAGKKK